MEQKWLKGQNKWLGQGKRQQWFVTALPPQSELGSPDSPCCSQLWWRDVGCSCLCVHRHLLRLNVGNKTWTSMWNYIIWTKWAELMNERVRFTLLRLKYLSKITLASPSPQAQPHSWPCCVHCVIARGWVSLWIEELSRKKSLRVDHPLALGFLILRAKWAE